MTTHTSTYPPHRGGPSLPFRDLRRPVYFKLMIVSTTVTNKLLDVVDVLAVVDGGGGGGSDLLPVVGISPAKVEAERVSMSTTTSANRFIDSAPIGV